MKAPLQHAARSRWPHRVLWTALAVAVGAAGARTLTTTSAQGRAAADGPALSARHTTLQPSPDDTRALRALNDRLVRLEQQQHLRAPATQADHELTVETVSDEDETVPLAKPESAFSPASVYKGLEAKWSQDAHDGSASRDIERTMATALAKPNPAATVRSIECRASMCRLSLEFGNSEARARFEAEHLGQPPFDRGSFLHDENDQGSAVSMYAMREVGTAR